MRTIVQSVEVGFYAIGVKDVITLLPTMDKLVNDINDMKEQIKKDEEKIAKEERAYYYHEHKHLLDSYIKQYKLLSSLGFVSTIDIAE